MSETIVPGALYIVSTPIGNLGDITQRAADILGRVDLIAAEDTRKTGFLLEHLCITKPLISYFSYNERRRVPELIAKLKGGMSIAVVTDAGTPGISDPAYSVIREAVAEGDQGHSRPRCERGSGGPGCERAPHRSVRLRRLSARQERAEDPV